MNKLKTGKVYKITSPTGRIYIGSTILNVKSRWNKYFNLKCKDQPRIYKSLKKYGPDKHIFDIIWEGNIEETLKMERILGEKYNCLGPMGLNCSLPGYDDIPSTFIKSTLIKISKTSTSRIFPERDEQYRKKVSAIHKGKKAPISRETVKYAIDKKKTKIDAYDINWNFIRSFSSMKDAADYFNVKPSNIFISAKSEGNKKCAKHRFKYSDKKTDMVYQIEYATYKLIKKWDFINDACKELNISRPNIVSVCRGRGKTAGGYIWAYQYKENE